MRRIFVIVSVLVAGIVLAALLLVSKPLDQPAETPATSVRPRAVLVGEITVDTHHILESLSSFIDTLERNGAVYASKRCDVQGRCDLQQPGRLPASAWRILQGVALKASRRDVAKGEKIIQASFEHWKTSADGISELHSFHQLLDAYSNGGSKELLGYTLNSLYLLERLATHYAEGDEASKSSPMLVATVARQLALVARIIGEGSDPLLDPDTASPGTRERLLSLSRKLVNKTREMSHNDQQPLVLGHPELGGQFACWAPWAQTAIFLATRSPDDLVPVKEFFENMKLRGRSLHDLDPGSLQMVLPCADALADLLVDIPEYAPDLITLLEQVVLVGWDSSEMPLCDGDGGVFAAPRIDYSGSSPCAGNVKSISDNAWLMRTLSKMPKTDLRIVRR